MLQHRVPREAEHTRHGGRAEENTAVARHLQPMKEGCGRDIALQEREGALARVSPSMSVHKKSREATYGCDDELELPWHHDVGLLEGGAFPGVVGAVVVVVVPDEVAVDEPGDRDGAELDEAKEEEQVKAGFLAVGRGGSHRWEMAGLVWIEVGKLSPCHIVLLNVFSCWPWYGGLRLS